MTAKRPLEPYKRYTDPTGEFSNRELDAATWYLKHRSLLERVGFVLLALTATVLMVISVAGWGNYLLVGLKQDKQMGLDQLALLQNISGLHQASGIVPLNVSGLNIFNSGVDTYDMVANVQNANRNWIVRATYHFAFNGTSTASVTTAILPGTARPIAILGEVMSAYPAGARLVFDNVQYDRVDPHLVSNIPEFIASHISFEVNNFVFTHAASGKQSVPAHDIHFELHNASAYSYWEPQFYVELRSRGVPVGMLVFTAEQLRANESRLINIRSLSPDLSVDDIALYPLVNPFDPAVYMSPSL